MKKEINEEYFIHNGIVMKKNSKKISLDKVNNVIYEVIRVIEGVPLFLEEHIARLSKSADLLNYNIEDILETIKLDTKKTIMLNENPELNLKILLYNIENPIPDYYIFFIDSNYPKEELYNTGIKTVTFKATRDNPNAKIINNEFRKNVNESIEKNNAYEALLLNDNDEITEGSRSNVFFVKNDTVYTPPGSKVLLGTTRNKIIKICNDLNIRVCEEPVNVSFINNCDALFITGTSPKVLPISQVDDKIYGSPDNKIVLKIMESYNNLIEDYIASH
ncbi:MAG: hypothetical protein GX154_09745 [Clostridiales bacterium]|nr:hypothetical protein [Clostridiales bacterium]